MRRWTYDVLEILAHTNLPHQLVLVTVHTSQLTDVGESELESIGQLERIDVSESVLDVRVDDELHETKDLTAEMERVSETRLLSLLGRQSLDRLEAAVGAVSRVLVRLEAMRLTSCCSRGGGSSSSCGG